LLGCPGDTANLDGDSSADGTTAPPVATTTSPVTGPGSATSETQTGGDSTTAPGTDDDGPGGLPPIKFDQGTIPDAPMFESLGCSGIDFLFVVDNSGSMSAQQAQLLASFQGFIDAILNTLDQNNTYHVGVISSDNYSGNAPGCTTIGDLVTQTAGFGALGQNCMPFAEGNRFATELDDISVKFPCMAQIGTSGSPIEQPVTATIAALDSAKLGPGGCNEGFLRDDAILVVVIVTDDPPYDFDMDDAHPLTVTTDWYDDVIAAKNNDPESLVVIGFIPWGDLSCVFGGDSPNLIGFIDSFGDQGVKASICEPDFGPIFAATVETIETTCANFIPG
jgi:hypothetical protein